MTANFPGFARGTSGLELRALLNLLSARRVASPAFITEEIGADQDDWEPSGLDDSLVISVTQDGGPFSITGLAGGGEKTARVIINDDETNTLTLKHLDSDSDSENQFNLGTTDLVLAIGEAAAFEYDTTSEKYVLGAVAVPFPLANDPGADGSLWHSGSGVPSASPDFGNDTDLYINDVNGDVYQKQSGSWVLLLNISGADGLPGLNWLGAWTASPSTDYAENDGVSNNGRSYICLAAHSSDSTNEPGAGVYTANYWSLLADKGADGTGTGDMQASVYDPNNVAADAFSQDNMVDGTTNKNYTGTEKSKLAGIASSADVTSATNVGSSIHGVTAKTTPVDADEVGLIDSAASNVLKKLTWANIKATLKTYFDTLYYAMGGTDVAVADGGTGASSASAARTNLGLAIGSDVQAFDATLHAGLGNSGAKTADYTLTLADANSLVGHSFGDDNARTFTIPANSSVAFPIGTTITIYNAINTLTIAWGGSGNLIWVPSGGTGNRTLAQWGICTAVKAEPDGWWISGVGLS